MSNLRESLVEEDGEQKEKYLTFTLDKETYGVGIDQVSQIITPQAIIPVPCQPSYINGFINLRGQIITVVDIRTLFKKMERDIDDKTCLIIMDVDSVPLGIMVDSVCEILSLEREEIIDAPDFKNSENRFISKIGKARDNTVLLLNSLNLLRQADMQSIEDAKAAIA